MLTNINHIQCSIWKDEDHDVQPSVKFAKTMIHMISTKVVLVSVRVKRYLASADWKQRNASLTAVCHLLPQRQPVPLFLLFFYLFILIFFSFLKVYVCSKIALMSF